MHRDVSAIQRGNDEVADEAYAQIPLTPHTHTHTETAGTIVLNIARYKVKTPSLYQTPSNKNRATDNRLPQHRFIFINSNITHGIDTNVYYNIMWLFIKAINSFVPLPEPYTLRH